MIIREAFKSLIKTKIFTIIIIFQLVVTSIVCNLVIEKISSMNKSYNDLNLYSQKSYLWISENQFDNELEHKFWNSENSLQRIKNYYTDMSKSDDYKYLEICKQEINIKTIDPNKNGYISAKNYSVNLDCLNEFGIKVTEGRLFTNSEMFINLSTETLPVLLGYNLKDKYKIGDVFEGTYLCKNFNFKVIGVLERNSHIIKTNIQQENVGEFYYEYFDNSYITPLVNMEQAPKNKDDILFQKILYMFKLNATIAAPINYNSGEIRSKMDALADKYDMYDFVIISMSNDKLSLLKLVSKNNIDIMIILAIVLFVFSLISLFAIFSAKIHKNTGQYAVHLMLGASKKCVAMYILAEVLIVLFLSHALSYMVTKIVFGSRVEYTILWMGLSIITIIAACIHPIFRLTKKELDFLLVGDMYE